MARSTWKREVVPKDIVTLSYSPERSHYPTSSLTFAAHPNVPILLLESIEFLVETVVCHTFSETDDSVVEITFNSEDAYAATLAAWSSLSQFMLLTSHPTCNPSDQRGAWLVSSVSGESFDSGITLQVHTVPLREAGSSFRISHAATGVTSAWGSPRPGSLAGRDNIDHVFPLDKTFDFAPRQQLLPVDTSLGNNSLLASLSDDIPDPQGMQVFCVDCVSVSKFSVGLELNVTDLDVNQAYINVTLDDFQHDIQLEFSLNDTASYQKTLDVLLLAIPDLGFDFPDVVTMGFFYGGAVRIDLEVAGELNFTVGASASIPAGATATFMLSQFNQSSAVGWDQAKFDRLALPFLEATLKIGTELFSATARLYVNTPHVSGAARVSTNVTRECAPLGPNDFEFFDAALTFGAGMNFSLDASSEGTLFKDSDTGLYTKTLPFGDFPTLDDPKCMIVADDAGSGDLAGQVVAPTGTLLAAATAIPSFDVAGIQSYYSANGALPTNVNYSQMLKATQVPDDIKKAVQKAGALGLHAMFSLASVFAAVALGGAVVMFF
ncbi:hypothetical protein B0H17DRAFT_1204507 [Mycena rosella]|uniref:DUF7029 domain-containing protein n=1 Tax=Mycena rosella TaxID=1033263 RepID=A0AAD7GB76_MYCRO|nr:hypothetical protein B0H17DRAFT_1204507 [Mycena rosella]